MAEIWLNPVYPNPARSAVGNNSVRLYVDGGWDLTDLIDSDTKKYDDVQQQYTFTVNDIYNSTIINNTRNINAVLYGLTEGAKNEVTVNITYSYWVIEWDSQKEDWGEWEQKTSSGQKNKGSLDVYTRNDKTSSDFWGDPQPGDYIDEHITQSNVNAWFDQFGVWKSWREQVDYYDYFNLWKDPKGDISAGWYNELSKECGGSYTVYGLSEVDSAENATHIQAEHFQDLARKVTDWS